MFFSFKEIFKIRNTLHRNSFLKIKFFYTILSVASSRHVALEWGDKDEVREEGGSKQMPPLAIVATLLGRITKVSITRTPVESGCFSP